MSIEDDNFDNKVDIEIRKCLDLENPKSFFIQAGAGSGKTSSLVKSLKYVDEKYGDFLKYNFKKVAVITYTNAACDEIKSRLSHIGNFKINTIHSFLWDLIKDHQETIKKWMLSNIKKELDDTKEKEEKGRKGTKASDDRIKKISIYEKKIIQVPKITRFIYNPAGINLEKDSLTHEDVIKIGSILINENTTLQKILIDSFPIILIDESQDTKKELVDSLLNLSNLYRNKIIIGMFGDTMQRVYLDGKANILSEIPTNWSFPVKRMNHRCSKRINALANEIRSNIDDIKQKSRSDAKEGIVRFFIVDINSEKSVVEIEKEIEKKMADYSKDLNWINKDGYQKLMLEHHMASVRMGFEEFFSPLYNNSKLKQHLIDGSLKEYSFLNTIVIPFFKSLLNDNKYDIMRILRDYSLLFRNSSFKFTEEKYSSKLNETNQAIKELTLSVKSDPEKSCLSFLKKLSEYKLFDLPMNLESLTNYDNLDEIEDDILISLFSALSCSINIVEKFNDYINKQTSFYTHQGVKGLEFSNVMVIMSDNEANGFLFKYDKLFGIVDKSDTDKNNENHGLDSSVTRTMRLFYVTCTRAKENLALVIYTDNPLKAKDNILERNWATINEIDSSFLNE